MRIDINKEVNLPKLQMEMLEVNLIEPNSYFGEHYFIAKEGSEIDLIKKIIDAHDTTPIPPKPTDKERIEQLENMILMMMEVI